MEPGAPPSGGVSIPANPLPRFKPYFWVLIAVALFPRFAIQQVVGHDFRDRRMKTAHELLKHIVTNAAPPLKLSSRSPWSNDGGDETIGAEHARRRFIQ